MNVLTRERQQDANEAALHASADGLTEELLAAYGDLSAPALFAPMVLDRRAKLMRFQTVSEVMLGQLSGEQELEVIERPNGVVMVIGGKVNVTWWPGSKRMTAYAENAAKGRTYATPKIVIAMALGNQS